MDCLKLKAVTALSSFVRVSVIVMYIQVSVVLLELPFYAAIYYANVVISYQIWSHVQPNLTM